MGTTCRGIFECRISGCAVAGDPAPTRRLESVVARNIRLTSAKKTGLAGGDRVDLQRGTDLARGHARPVHGRVDPRRGCALVAGRA